MIPIFRLLSAGCISALSEHANALALISTCDYRLRDHLVTTVALARTYAPVFPSPSPTALRNRVFVFCIEQVFDELFINLRPWTRSGRDQPFVALRAATLGIDDLSRQALRLWVTAGLDHHGNPIENYPEATEPAATAIIAALMTLESRDRAAYRLWVFNWTEHTGRIITPSEHARRQKEMKLPPLRELPKRGR